MPARFKPYLYSTIVAVSLFLTYPTTVFALSIGDRVKATASLNVRSCASTTCSIVTTESTGSTGAISNGPYSGSGYTWWYINWDNGYSGYSVQDYLAAIPGSFTLSLTTECIGTTSQIRLNWTSSSNATSYDVYRNGSLYYSGVTGTQFINTSVTAGTSYSYYVQAKNSNGSTNSSSLSATAPSCAAPSAPTSLVAVGSSNNILLVWADNSSNETGFKIERKTGTAGTYSQIITVNANVLSYQDSGLSFGNTYCYRVRAYNSNGDSAYSNESCGTALAAPVLSSPNDGATINTNSVTLQWNSVTGADSYSVEVASSCGGTNILTNPATYSPSITVTSIANGTYYWRVKAANTTTYFGLSDVSGCRTFTIAVTSALAPTVTTLAATNITSNSATLNGTVNPNGLSTTVYFQYSASTTSWLATGSSNAGSGTTVSTWQATPSGLNSNTTFYFRIVATNSAGTTYGITQTFITQAASLTAPSPISPGETVGSTHTPIAYSSITFSWSKNNTGATYNLYVRDITGYADDVSTSYGTLVINGQSVGDASSYTWTGATAGKKYRWQVEVVKSGYTSVLSNKLVFETQAAVPDIRIDPTSLTF